MSGFPRDGLVTIEDVEAAFLLSWRAPLRNGDLVIAYGTGPNPTYATVRIDYVAGERIHYAVGNDGYVRQILLRDEDRTWTRGHGDDAMAALLLTRSAQ